MKMKEVDARGLDCPKPVILVKQEIEKGTDRFDVLIDSDTAKENVTRLARKMGYSVGSSEDEGHYRLEVKKSDSEVCAEASGKTGGSLIFVGSDKIGRGNDELGGVLARAFFNSLPDSESLPSKIVFMNEGVKLACKGSQVLESLESLEKLAVEILVCGTCLDFFGLKESLEAGRISNMLEIQQSFIESSNVISV